MANKAKIIPMPFNTSDWLRCPELKVLSPDAKGLWMDMLCYMWESPERGVLLKPNGDVVTRAEIIRMIGVDASGSDAWLDHLIDNDVCGVREDGAIYSRRMVRDAEISRMRSDAGRKGGYATKARGNSVISTEIKPAPAPTPKPKERSKPSEPQKPVQEDLFGDPPPLTPEQDKKAQKAKKYKYADDVTLTRDEYAKLCEAYGEDDTKGIINVLSNYKGQNGKRYKSDYKAILNWVVNAYYEKKQQGYVTQRTGANPGNGTPDNQGSAASSTGKANPGEIPGGDQKAQKNYSERFT